MQARGGWWRSELIWPILCEVATRGCFATAVAGLVDRFPVVYGALAPTKPLNEDTVRRGVLVDHPAVQQHIIQILADLRGAGVPLNVSVARGVILGVLERALPGLVSEKFLCSTNWVRDFVYMVGMGHGGQGA